MNVTPILAAIVKCYVGCNTGAPDGQTMHVLDCDTETGKASIVQTVKGVQGTTYFAFDRDARNLYSYVGETVGGRRRGALVRFAVEGDGRIGEMTRLAALPCETPCHIALSPDGKTAGFAAYTSATAGTMPAAGGEVKSAVHSNEGVGPNKKRQTKAHAHCAFFTPDGSHLGIIDLGTDRINFYDPATMEPRPEMTIRADPGDGPRHAVWSNDGRFLFVVNELGNTVLSFAFDGKRFVRIGKWRTLPEGVGDDASKASAIKLTADGSILMASNRGHDSIAFFSVDAGRGTLTLRNIAKLTGSFPRDFELMPGERFMVVGHKMSNEIQVYRFDRTSCTLEPAGKPIPCWRPLCFKFRPSDDQDAVWLETAHASAEVSLHGGRILSFAVGGDEVLWRPRAWRLEGERWAHGGIPLCWPWFGSSGPDPKVIHGFVRTQRFAVRRQSRGQARCELVLGLSSNAETKRRWPCDFDLEYRIVLTDRLRLELKTVNTGTQPFLLTAGFHPYFAIGDRDRTVVTGTDGMKFCDSRVTTEYRDVWRGDMPLTSSFDHVFVDPRDTAFHAIRDPVRRRTIGLSSAGAARLVVWNPGAEEQAWADPAPGALAIGDWRHIICVEPAILWKEAARTVEPGGTHLLTAEITSAPADPAGKALGGGGARK